MVSELYVRATNLTISSRHLLESRVVISLHKWETQDTGQWNLDRRQTHEYTPHSDQGYISKPGGFHREDTRHKHRFGILWCLIIRRIFWGPDLCTLYLERYYAYTYPSESLSNPEHSQL